MTVVLFSCFFTLSQVNNLVVLDYDTKMPVVDLLLIDDSGIRTTNGFIERERIEGDSLLIQHYGWHDLHLSNDDLSKVDTIYLFSYTSIFRSDKKPKKRKSKHIRRRRIKINSGEGAHHYFYDPKNFGLTLKVLESQNNS